MVAIILLSLGLGRWLAGGADLSRFSVIGTGFAEPEALPAGLRPVVPDGYDGQFYTRLAFDPLTRVANDFGIRLDLPVYRAQRVGYPALAYLLSFGRPRLVPLALIVVNGIALSFCAWLLALLAQEHGLSPALGLLAVAAPGALLCFARDLAEPVAAAAVLAALLLLRQARFVPAYLLLLLAALTRETSLVSAAGLTGALLLQGPGRARLAAVLGSGFLLLLFGLWQLHLWQVWGELPFRASPPNLGLPGVGLLTELKRSLAADRPVKILGNGVGLLWLLWLGVLVVRSLRATGPKTPWPRTVLPWLLWTAFAACFSTLIWEDDWSFARVLLEWSMLGIATLLMAGVKPARGFLVFTTMVLALNAARVIARV